MARVIWKQVEILTLCSSFVICTSSLMAEDRRKVLATNERVESVELVDSNQTGLALSLQQSTPALQQIFKDAGTAEVSSTQIDLNNDGNPETFIQLRGLQACGFRDCQLIILTQTSAGALIIFSDSVDTISVGPQDQSGWKKLISNVGPDDKGRTIGLTWVWKGQKYEIEQ